MTLMTESFFVFFCQIKILCLQLMNKFITIVYVEKEEVNSMLKAQLFIRKDVLYSRLNGELDQRSIESLKVKISELIINYRIKHLVLNCKDLLFMDSSGIGFIIGRYNQLKENGGKVFLCDLNELVEKIVRISGVSRIVVVKPSERDVEVLLEGTNEKVCRNAI